MNKRLTKNLFPRTAVVLASTLLGFSAAAGSQIDNPSLTDLSSSVIVQGQDLEILKGKVLEVDGTVTHELGIINAVGADLTPTQIAHLEASGQRLRVSANHAVETAARGGNKKTANSNDVGGNNTHIPTIPLR